MKYRDTIRLVFMKDCKMKKALLTILVIFCNLMVAKIANGAPSYNGTCQDVGYNDQGQNILVSCSKGLLSAPGCTFINKDRGVINVICDDSQYIYSCGPGPYNGNWYKVQQNSYKCVT